MGLPAHTEIVGLSTLLKRSLGGAHNRGVGGVVIGSKAVELQDGLHSSNNAPEQIVGETLVSR